MGTGQSREDTDEKKTKEEETKREEKVDAVREFVTGDEEMGKREDGEREREKEGGGERER